MTDRRVPETDPHLRVALDAMGGDHAPDAIVAGALLACADGVRVVLVGDPDRVRAALEAHGAEASHGIEVVAASEVVGMDEDPAVALRSKRDASVRVAATLVAEGRAGALLSMGSTGATLAAGLLAIGRLPGVRRPAVAAVLPSPGAGGRGTVLLDAGASPDVQPEALRTYALMGSAYAEVLGVDAPRVGLLNVGEEAGKGSAFAKAAFDELSAVPGFAGNVEPAAVLAGAVDVVVTDGFTGNIFLKTVEAVRPAQHDAAQGEARDAAAILLGCTRPVLVGHGAAGPAEVAAALRTAAHMIAADLPAHLRERIAARTDASAETREVAHG